MLERSFGVVTLAIAVLMPFAASAEPNPAAVITGSECTIADENGNLNMTTDTRLIATQSPNGALTVVCKFDLDPTTALAGNHAFVASGFPCVVQVFPVPPAITTNSHAVIAASGRTTLTCQIP